MHALAGADVRSTTPRVPPSASGSAAGAGGLRVLAVATRTLPERPRYTRDDERDLTLEGFVVFTDPPKATAPRALADLAALGVGVKMITGDHHLVARHVARAVGLDGASLMTGAQLDELHDEALWSTAERTAIFAEVDPNQKSASSSRSRRPGVVGFMGDGINDAPAMHAADTSISVESAVDVARDAADFVLLEQDLDVVRRGITLGRTTFANTLKYIQTTLSANLGNMIMAAASLFLPFLPLLAGQILLNNFLSDIPAFGLAGDSVDPELVTRPRRWNVRELRRFMIQFGLLSSVFDLATFGVLLLVYRAAAVEFRTALVRRIAAHRVGDRPRGPYTFFLRSRPVGSCSGLRSPLAPWRSRCRIRRSRRHSGSRPPAGAGGSDRGNHDRLRGRCRIREACVLSQRQAGAPRPPVATQFCGHRADRPERQEPRWHAS